MPITVPGPIAHAFSQAYLLCRYVREATMRVRVQKWGNSLAVRIPKALAAEVQAVEQGDMEMTIERGRLVLEPVTAPRYTLEALLSQVTSRNRHGEIDFGDPVGKERT